MKKDFDVIQKKINLHGNEITRIQGLSGKMAMKKGLNDGELKRGKARLNEQNKVIHENKDVGKSLRETINSAGATGN